MVAAFTIIMMFMVVKGLLCGHSREIKVFHQSVHSADTDVNAIITLKNVSDLVSTKPLIIIGINLKDHLTDLLIFPGAVSRIRTEMLVIGASVDT